MTLTAETVPHYATGPRPARRPIAIDLFSGAGGLSLGLEQAGFDIAAAVEYDPIHCAVHAFNFPRTEVICGDISTVSRRELTFAVRSGLQMHEQDVSTWDGQVDLIAGGPPCQGFSTIGKRLVDDSRNRLVFEFFRVVDEMRPRYFLMENVPGMMAGGHKTEILDRLIAEFAEVGYRVVEPIRILHAQLFGVPQDRRRLFVLGARDDQELPDYPVAVVRPRSKNAIAARLPERLFDNALPSGPTVWEAIGDLPDADAFTDLLASDEVALPPEIFAEMTVKASDYARRLRGEVADPHDFSHPRSWDASLLTSSMRTAHTEVSVNRFDKTPPGTVEPISRFYRLTQDGLCNTIRAGTGSEHGAFTSPRPIHPVLPRVLTVREAARLHSMPDWFRLHRTKWHGFRQVGNAVPPLLGRAVGASLMRALGTSPTAPHGEWELGSEMLLGMEMRAAAAHFRADESTIPAQRTRLSVRSMADS